VSSLYVSVGHGLRPNGTFDPGAVHTASGALEYDGNRELAGAVTDHLRAMGHQVVSEADAEYKTDTDYQGSVDAVNAGTYWLAVDFHQDWEQGSTALCWPLVHPAGGESHRVASQINSAVAAAGLTTKGPTGRTDLWWLNGTDCAAILIEAGRVGTPRPVADLAEAIAAGINIAARDPGVPDGELPGSAPPGAPPGDATIPPPGEHPAWPGTLLVNVTSGHGAAAWQAQMAKRGWALGVDDIFGPQSERVAAQFQAEKGLATDGVVGPETWAAAWTAPVS
jgi:peptidoglycan hydrolase-like protein with peptidoglycan-binding domain